MAIVGTDGNDNLVGTTGDDTINALKRSAPGTDTVDGLAGIDTLVVNAAGEADGVQLSVGGSPVFAVRSNSGNYYVDAYNMERVQFTGGLGNDSIETGNHGGTVNGGGGVDSWTADLGALVSDVAFTLGTTTSIAAADLTSIKNLEQINLTTGTGNDTITGGALGDHIATGAGNDTIDAQTVFAGGPTDVVDGGADIDTLIVDASAETDGVQLSSGGSPTFAVRSNSGNFYVDAYNMEKVKFTGGSADDLIDTGNHGGTIDGGAGVDSWTADLSAVSSSISFVLGTTTSIAAAGLTSILNLEQIDLTTGTGNDKITGGALGDHIATGAGNDTIDAQTVFAGGPTDVVDGGADIDTLIVDASAETDGVQLSSGGSPTFAVRSNSGNFYVDAYNMEKVKFTGGSADDLIDTGNHGGTIDGGAGVDSWTADLSAVSSSISFVLGTTTSIAAAGLTSILNLERIDLSTGIGNDVLVGGLQGDHLSAGAGNDTLDARTRPIRASATDVVDGGAGSDTLIVDASAETQGVRLSSGGSPTFAVRSNSGNFYVDAYNMEVVNFTGGSANDTIDTGNHGGTIDGGAGVDSWTADLSAVSSNIAFTLGTTTSIAAAGLTSILNLERVDLTTGSGNDTLVGGLQADHLAAGAGNDTIDARTRPVRAFATDVVDGGAGSDTLIVDASAETQGVRLFSGGSPTFAVRSNSGNFYVDAYNMEVVRFTGGSANDTIDTGNHGGAVNGGAGVDLWTADLSAVASSIAFTVGTTTSLAAAGLTALKNLERVDLTTGGGNDTLVGGDFADRLAAGGGNDTINAGRRSAGASPIDLVYGGAGTDTLIVDASSETMGVQLDGGSNPTFTVRSNSGNFAVDAYDMEKVVFTGGSGNDFAGGAAGNDVLATGAGKDALWGGAGNDSLTGGADADLFGFGASNNGTDTVADFSGQTAFGGGAGQHDVLAFTVLSGTFAYLGGGAFTGTGNTEARASAGNVFVDFDGNGTADINIKVTGLASANQLTAADFTFI